MNSTPGGGAGLGAGASKMWPHVLIMSISRLVGAGAGTLAGLVACDALGIGISTCVDMSVVKTGERPLALLFELSVQETGNELTTSGICVPCDVVILTVGDVFGVNRKRLVAPSSSASSSARTSSARPRSTIHCRCSKSSMLMWKTRVSMSMISCALIRGA